jgi:hypothetical protein
MSPNWVQTTNADVKTVLADFKTYYPDSKGYEIAGFLFWQGDKDRYKTAHATHYEKNLVQLINALRKEFDAPEAKFVCATLGQSEKDKATGNDKLILDAQLAVDGKSGKHPEFEGNVATVYTNPISQGGASNGHYNGNAKTYMDVGLAMGVAMVEMLTKKRSGSVLPDSLLSWRRCSSSFAKGYGGQARQLATMFTSRPGTTMILRIVLPSVCSRTFGAAWAAASMSSLEASLERVMRSRSLPLTCTTSSISVSMRASSSWVGHGW